MTTSSGFQVGQVIGVCGAAIVIYDGDDLFGNEWGHIVDGRGRVYLPKDLLNLMKFNPWRRPGPSDPQTGTPMPLPPHRAEAPSAT